MTAQIETRSARGGNRSRETRPHSPIWRSPRLKDVIVAAALAGQITQQDAADLFVEYGLKEV
jgi:hypothetical protein